MSPSQEGLTDEGLRILDSNGCLTQEVLCFPDQLTPEQEAVVVRHTRSCPICAEQHAALAGASERFRRKRPRLALPAELRQLARQAVLRAVIDRGMRAGARLRLPAARATLGVVPWYRSRAFWTATLAGLAAASLVVAAVALLR